jgi:hypothetical protein
MRLKPLKFLVQAVALELDEEGAIVGERVAEPVAFYRPADVTAFVTDFAERLAKEQEQDGQGGKSDAH